MVFVLPTVHLCSFIFSVLFFFGCCGLFCFLFFFKHIVELHGTSQTITNGHNIERSISSMLQSSGAACKAQVRAPLMNMGVTPRSLCREPGYDRNEHVNGLVKRWVFCLYMKTYGHPGNVYATISLPVQRKALMHGIFVLKHCGLS